MADTDRNRALILCYLSDQIEEVDWQHLLETEFGLREAYAAYIQAENDRLNRQAELARAIS